jgi:TM2 domain-containing membrane protein YozV
VNKKPWVAFILSFLLPGAGLAYLGKWGWGLLNLVSVIVVGAAVTPFNLDPSIISAIGMGLAAGSAALAKSLAVQMKTQVTPLAVPAPQASAGPAVVRGPATLFEIPAAPAKPAAAKCPKCGTANESGNFCVECGSPL